MIVDNTKKVFYAAVGVPVVTTRKLSERVTKMSSRLTKDYDVWAEEGEKVVTKVTDRKAVEDFVEDLGAKMDFDQIQEQVGKLRGQLDDMLTNWRSSFRPATEKAVPAKPATAKPAAKATTAAKKPVAKKATTTASKKPVAKKVTTTA
jgi:hypothetical protein